jgi:hypothetical protein
MIITIDNTPNYLGGVIYAPDTVVDMVDLVAEAVIRAGDGRWTKDATPTETYPPSGSGGTSSTPTTITFASALDLTGNKTAGRKAVTGALTLTIAASPATDAEYRVTFLPNGTNEPNVSALGTQYSGSDSYSQSKEMTLFVSRVGGITFYGWLQGPTYTPISITGTPPATAGVGTAYTFDFGATGGTAPYTFSLQSGTLPAGLGAVNSSTGVSTGTPTTGGTSSGLVVRVTDALGAYSDSASFSIAVASVYFQTDFDGSNGTSIIDVVPDIGGSARFVKEIVNAAYVYGNATVTAANTVSLTSATGAGFYYPTVVSPGASPRVTGTFKVPTDNVGVAGVCFAAAGGGSNIGYALLIATGQIALTQNNFATNPATPITPVGGILASDSYTISGGKDFATGVITGRMQRASDSKYVKPDGSWQVGAIDCFSYVDAAYNSSTQKHTGIAYIGADVVKCTYFQAFG